MLNTRSLARAVTTVAGGLARPRRRVRRSNPRGVESLESRSMLSGFATPLSHDAEVRSVHPAVIESSRRVGADTVKLDLANHDHVSRESRFRHIASAPTVIYYNSSSVGMQPVSAWQGIRGAGSKGQYLIAGTSSSTGLLQVGTIAGVGTSDPVMVPGSATTSVYGPNNLGGGRVQLVGSYKNANASTAPVAVNGFLYQGSISDLPSGGAYRTIDFPGARFNFVHSTMGGLAVGNADGPTASGLPLGPGTAYIYGIAKSAFLTNIVFPGSTSDTAYGIWHNGGSSYTICGGSSDASVNNVGNQNQPIGQAYLVDYNSATGRFSHWKSFNDPTGLVGTNYITHFEGISGVKKGVYTLSADSLQTGSIGPAQGSFVTVKRNRNGTFGNGAWVNLNYPGVVGVSSSNSVSGNQVVGVVFSNSGVFPFQATVKPRSRS